MLEKLFIGAFGKVMTAVVVMLVAINAYLCFQNKTKAQKIALDANMITQQRQINRQLAEQVTRTNQQIRDYQTQVKALQQRVLDRLKQSEQRHNELMQILEKNKPWADQPVPTDISKLFEQRNATNGQPHALDLPNGSTLPTAPHSH